MAMWAVLLDLFTVHLATNSASIARDRLIRVAEKLKTDPDKAVRLEKLECPYCWYANGDRLAGAMFTQWYCRACNKESMHHHTSHPSLCNDCANKYGLCCQCCADLDLKQRKTLERKGGKKAS